MPKVLKLGFTKLINLKCELWIKLPVVSELFATANDLSYQGREHASVLLLIFDEDATK